MRTRWAALVGGCVVLAAAAVGQMATPLHAQRSLDLYAQLLPLEPMMASDAGSGFEPWLGDEQVAQGDVANNLRARAVQYSEVSADTLLVYGYVELQATHQTWGVTAIAVGDLEYEVRFALPAPAAYELAGDVLNRALAEGACCNDTFLELAVETGVRLSRVSGGDTYDDQADASLFLSYPPFQPPLDVAAGFTPAESGILPAGVYDLTLSAHLTMPNYDTTQYQLGNLQASTAFVLELHLAPPPPPATCGLDLDGDGDVDLVDLAAMQSCFTGPTP